MGGHVFLVIVWKRSLSGAHHVPDRKALGRLNDPCCLCGTVELVGTDNCGGKPLEVVHTGHGLEKVKHLTYLIPFNTLQHDQLSGSYCKWVDQRLL